MKLNSTSQKWRAFPETSARLVPSPFSFVSNPSHCEGFSNVPFLGVRSRILVFLYLNVVNMMSHCFMEDEVGAGFRW